MSAQPDPAKQNIIDWCNADNISCIEEDSHPPGVDWTLLLDSKIRIYKQTKYPDRIYFQSGITIAPEHQTVIKNSNQIKNDILLQIPTVLAQMDVASSISQEDNTISHIIISKVHFHSTIKKADFLTLYVRLYQVQHVLLNQLSFKLQVSLQQLQQTPPPTGDVGIQ